MLPPEQHVRIFDLFCSQIVMQPLKELPTPAQLWKDKFLIQVLICVYVLLSLHVVPYQMFSQAAYISEDDAEGSDAKTLFDKVQFLKTVG